MVALHKRGTLSKTKAGPQALADANPRATARNKEDAPTASGEVKARADRSSNSLSVLVIISRITGFFRTTVQAWALGAAGLASAYTVANNLPNLLYEYVAGGMLITAFLPVYMHVKKTVGKSGASEYVSNLLSIVTILMAVISVLCLVFATPIIWTQSAGAAEGFSSTLAVYFFRWFCCEVVLYALSSIFSGVLNAERDFLWSYIGPILNNVITIASFAIYGLLVNQDILAWNRALIVLAVGNPLGVAVQVVCQIPSLKRHGVRLTLRCNLHDPALRETISIGLPTFLATFATAPTSAVTSSCALSVTPAGASISYYARVWYVLPYSIFAIPITTTLFTELSNTFLSKDYQGFKEYLSIGLRKILFTLVPCMMFLIVFAKPLIAVFAGGAFTGEDVELTAGYLAVLAVALPFYSVASLIQKVCSSMMSMNFYAIAVCVGSVIQIVVCLLVTPVGGLYVVPVTSALFYITLDVMVLARVRMKIGPFGLAGVARTTLRAIVLGLAGSLVGVAIQLLLNHVMGPASGMLQGLIYVAAGGIPALIVTFGTASYLGISEAPFFDAIFSRLLDKRRVPVDKTFKKQ